MTSFAQKTAEEKALTLSALLRIGHLQQSGYLTGGPFEVQLEQVAASAKILAATEDVTEPTVDDSVREALRLMLPALVPSRERVTLVQLLWNVEIEWPS